jgi:hypothetical protein
MGEEAGKMPAVPVGDVPVDGDRPNTAEKKS